MKRKALGAFLVLFTTAALASERGRYFVATERPVHEAGVNARVNAWPSELGDPGERRVAAFRIVNGFSADLTAAEVETLRRSPGVRYVEPVVSRHLHATISQPGRQIIPYGISLVRAPEAWRARISGEVNVVVIDSGVDSSHSELLQAWAGGYNVLDPASPPVDGIGHGTHVAGIVAAANNNLGVVGVAPSVRLWGVKAMGDDGNGSMENVLQGIEWVLEKKKAEGGRWIVNLSLGGSRSSVAEAEAFARATAEGLMFVASTGNESTVSQPVPVTYPAAYPDVIAVGAVDKDRDPARFSNAGPEVDFAAPGVQVISLSLHGDEFVSYVRTQDQTILVTRPLEGSKQEVGITAEYVHCGLGTPADFGPAVSGKIALIQRGIDTFADKARRAKEAGAVAVLFYNNVPTGGIYWTLYPPEDPEAKNYPWPAAVGISQEDGETLVASGGGRITIGYDPDDYAVRTGTSMSAPHVAGAAAVLWGLAPDATAAQIVNALMSTARDVAPAGRDDKTGYGLIDVHAAARMLAPAAFGRTTGRRFLKRH